MNVELRYPDRPAPVQLTRKAPDRSETRLLDIATARAAFAQFGKGCETTCYTFGQFSLIDAVVVMLEKTGPVHLDVCVWTVGMEDMLRVRELREAGHLLSLRWVVDQGFESRQPGYCAALREIYGDDTIRTLRAHAKFLLFGNDDWAITIRTSMNLNNNVRFEHLDVTDDRQLYDWHRGVVDGIFDAAVEGDFKPKSHVVIGSVVQGERLAGGVSRGRVVERGHVRVGRASDRDEG